MAFFDIKKKKPEIPGNGSGNGNGKSGNGKNSGGNGSGKDTAPGNGKSGDLLEKRFIRLIPSETEKPESPPRSSDTEILMFESLPIIHNSIKDYIVVSDDQLIASKKQIDKMSDSAKIHWLPSLRIGLTGKIGIRFLDYFQLTDDKQLSKLIKKFNDCQEKLPEKMISIEYRQYYFFACLSGKYCFCLKNCNLITESDLGEDETCEKNHFILFSSSESQALRSYYIWILYPMFLKVVPDKLRKKLWKDPSNVAKLIFQCRDPREYLPLERLKTMKNVSRDAGWKIDEKTKFCTKSYDTLTLEFFSEIIRFICLNGMNGNQNLDEILECKGKAEKILQLRQEIEDYNPSPDDITFNVLDDLIGKIKEYDSISKKKLRLAIKPEDRKKLFPGKCYVCNVEVNLHNGTAGHIDAASHSGSSDLGNLLPLCGSCNSKMGNINLYEYLFLNGQSDKVPDVNLLVFKRFNKEKDFLIGTLAYINFQNKECINILNNTHLPIKIRFKIMDILFQLLKLVICHAAISPK